MFYSTLKKIGMNVGFFTFFAIITIMLISFLSRFFSDLLNWFRLIINGNVQNIEVILLIIVMWIFIIAVSMYFLGLFIDFLFGKPPSILLEKKAYTLTEEERNKISVIIPAYNEEKTIGRAIEAVKPYCKNVIVINDGSTDNTEEQAVKHGAILITHKTNKGLGESLKDGIQKALELNSEIIINFDADLQYDARDIPSLAYYIIKGRYDLIMGSRFAGKIEEMPTMKKVGNKLYTKLLRLLTGIGLSDGQTGFRAFTAEFAKSIKIRGDYTYTQEMILEAAAIKAKIGEIPIFFAKRFDGKSRLMKNPFHFAKSSGIFLLKVLADLFPYKLSTVFALIIALFGTLIGGYGYILLMLHQQDMFVFLYIYTGILFVTAATFLEIIVLFQRARKG